MTKIGSPTEEGGTPGQTPATAAPGMQQSTSACAVNPEGTNKKKVDLVLEGGGVKGIAIVGAMTALEETFAKTGEHEYGRCIGTSAGAIVAALLGAGYKAKELAEIVAGPEIARFADRTGIARLPGIGGYLGRGLGVLTRLGMFKGDYFQDFLRSKLLERNIRTFRDLIVPGYENETTDLIHKYRVHMIASDITRGRMLILPDDVDVEHYGVRPDDLEVAAAVRMSVSVPFVFTPVTCQGLNGVKSYIVDGGLLSNFPVQAFDRAPYPARCGASPEELELRRASIAAATIGVRLLGNRYHEIRHPFIAFRAAYALISTALEAHDTRAAMKFDSLRSNRIVNVDTHAVSTLRFSLTPLEREVLFTQGYEAMKSELRSDFLARATAAATISRNANAQMEP